MISRVTDVDCLAIEDPDAYDRLLRSYFLLLGRKPTLWWQEDAGAVRDGWPRAVRAAIEQLAESSGVPARVLADWLDDEALPRARAKVIELARNHSG